MWAGAGAATLASTRASPPAGGGRLSQLYLFWLAWQPLAKDVSALAGCAGLRTLNLAGTEVTDMSALAGCSSLHSPNLYSTEVADVPGLAGCSNLHRLD